MLKHRLTGLCLAFALVAGAALAVVTRAPEAEAGHVVLRTDVAQRILLNFWDLRGGRKSFFQVTNTSASPQRIHIQIFDTRDPNCEEAFDYFDDLTPFDTHVYDLSALDRNNGAAVAPPDLTGGYGVVAVSVVDGSGALVSQDVLTGNFVIKDPAGYQYRTNSAGWNSTTASDENWRVNFNSLGATTFADLVLFNVDTNNNRVEVVSTSFDVTLYDEHENPISCPQLSVDCVSDLGVNELIVNSLGEPSVCLGNDSVGSIYLEAHSGDFLVGFVGLNDGSSKGSMDAWINTDSQ